MAKSYVTYEGNGSTTTYPVTFPYLAKLHVYVLVGGEKTDEWEWLTNNSIKLDKAPTGPFSFIRRTPTEPLVDFADGTILTENQLDVATVQALYVAEEASDLARYSLNNNPESPGGDGINWNAEGKKIINLANGTNPTDAVNRGQLDAIIPDIQEEVKKAEDAADEAEEWAKKAEDAVDDVAGWAGVAEDWADEAEDWAKEAEYWADKAEGHEKDAQAIVDSFNPAVTLMGDADVTKTAPIAKEGDAYINTVTGVAHSSWGSNFSGRTIKKDMLMVFGRDNDWHDTDLYSGIWKEKDGVAIYDGEIKVNGVDVGKGSGTGIYNTRVGYYTLDENTTGQKNTAFGALALRQNKTGTQNTAIGAYALGVSEDGTGSTAVGDDALYKATGEANTAVGINTGRELETGDSNTFIGRDAGRDLVSGSNNTCLGHKAKPSTKTVSNEVTIGNDDVVTMRSHGGKYAWSNGTSYTQAQQTSKDGNSYLRTKVFDDGVVNFETLGTFNISTPSVMSLKTNSVETLRLRSDNTATFRSNLDVEGTLRVTNIQSAGAPNVYVDPDGRLYKSAKSIDSGVPTGAIMMWSGATSTIPSGWKLCDGSNGTPNLVNRFIAGAGHWFSLKQTGGYRDAVNVSHTHPVTINTKTGLNGSLTLLNRGGTSGSQSLMRGSTGSITHTTQGAGSFAQGWEGEGGSNSSKATFTLDHNHTGSAVDSGVDGADKNLPPFIALYYIMKTSSSRAVEEGQENVETIYSNKEVDKKLSIKDKLIEKLSERLDKLEKRIN